MRSQRWYGPDDMRGISHRARSRQMGFSSEDFAGKPKIGILNTWSDMNTCHSHFKQRVEEIKRGVWEAGGFPIELPAMSLGEIMVKPSTMMYRNFLAMEAEELIRTFIVEEYTWKRDVLTAHRATTMQAFRELFDEEVLRPGDDVEIDSVTIMFTDFKGSTALYERLGDSRAYHLIREFFAVLGQAVRENSGTVVKTIGDAVNAAFSNPADALACAIQIQKDVEAFNQGSNREPITVTIGLHVGRCISVTLNDQLDYYGTAANKAARLEGKSRGGDVVLSREFCEDPTVAGLLENYNLVAETADLKGFDQPVDYFRITAAELAEKRSENALVV